MTTLSLDSAFRRLRDQALAAERHSVVKLRNQGKVSEEVLHRVQEALDLANIAIYGKRATGEKFLINPNKSG